MSGHCSFPQSDDPQQSHDRCANMGGGNRWNPQKEFSPCPCPCHYPGERYECGNCGGTITEATLWPYDDDGDVRWTHIDLTTGRATGEECEARVSRNQRFTSLGQPEEPEIPEPDEYTGFEDPEEEDDFADLLEDDEEEDDLFAGLEDLMEDD